MILKVFIALTTDNMVQGIGTDIIEIDRISSNLQRYGEKFLEKILTAAEIKACSHLADLTLHLAGRFAAKEAISKALGTGFGEHLEFHDIEILNNEAGKPLVGLSKKTSVYFNHPTILVSISHCKSHATATAIQL